MEGLLYKINIRAVRVHQRQEREWEREREKKKYIWIFFGTLYTVEHSFLKGRHIICVCECELKRYIQVCLFFSSFFSDWSVCMVRGVVCAWKYVRREDASPFFLFYFWYKSCGCDPGAFSSISIPCGAWWSVRQTSHSGCGVGSGGRLALTIIKWGTIICKRHKLEKTYADEILYFYWKWGGGHGTYQSHAYWHAPFWPPLHASARCVRWAEGFAVVHW